MSDKIRTVIVESPYAGDLAANRRYARAALRDCLSRGEAPFASHLLYTQPGVLRDGVAAERQWGIDAGLAIGRRMDATVVYTDRGYSVGMRYGIAAAQAAGRPVEYRSLTKGQEPKSADNSGSGTFDALVQQPSGGGPLGDDN